MVRKRSVFYASLSVPETRSSERASCAQGSWFLLQLAARRFAELRGRSMLIYGWQVITVQWVLAGLALSFILLRLYARLSKADNKHKLGDLIIIAAWLGYAIWCACVTALWHLDFLVPTLSYTSNLTSVLPDVAKNTVALKIIYAAVLIYLTDLWLVKAAVILFYYSITPEPLSRLRYVLHFMSVFTAVTYVAVITFNSVGCLPIRNNWSSDPEKFCHASARLPVYFVSICSQTITDLIIFCFSFPLLRTSKLYRHDRKAFIYGVVFLLVLGGLSIAATLVRLATVSHSPDMPRIALWTAVELSSGIMAACTPFLRILLRRPSSHAIDEKGDHESRPATIGSGPPRLPSHRRIPTFGMSDIWDGTFRTAPSWLRLESKPDGERESWSTTASTLTPGSPGIARNALKSWSQAAGPDQFYSAPPPSGRQTMPLFRLTPGGVVESIPRKSIMNTADAKSIVASVHNHSGSGSSFSWKSIPEVPIPTDKQLHKKKSSNLSNDITSMLEDAAHGTPPEGDYLQGTQEKAGTTKDIPSIWRGRKGSVSHAFKRSL